jgi:hydrogenase maturation protease
MLAQTLIAKTSQLSTPDRRYDSPGIGNELGGDHAGGTCLMDMLNPTLGRLSARQHKAKALHPGAIAITDAGTAPETYTSVSRRCRPDLLILVDADHMGLPPGSSRTIGPERISTVSFSTHHMPLSLSVSYVNEFCGKVLLVGV